MGLHGVGAPQIGLLSSLPVIRAGKSRGLLALHVRCVCLLIREKTVLF